MPNTSTTAKPTRPMHLPGARRAEELAVVHLVAEYWPYARTGGLAEAVRGIATFQAVSGTPVTVFLPLYRSIRDAFPDLEPARDPYFVQVGSRLEEARIYQPPGPRQNPRVLFVAHDGFFGRSGLYGQDGADYPDNPLRFGFYNLAVLQVLSELANVPVVVHAHDWHTALASVFLRTKFAGNETHDRMAAVLSIHNAGYQGLFGPEVLDDVGLPRELYHWRWMEYWNHLNLLKGGLVFSDYVTTVSPTHAHELRTRAGGFGLHQTFIELQDRFVGIRNGIDLDVWNPEQDLGIEATYSRFDLTGKPRCKQALQREHGLPEYPRVPLFGMTARLVAQKGLDLLLDGDVLDRAEAQFVFLGEGERRYEEALRAKAAQYPDRIIVDTAFSEPKEHRLLAGADMLLMPSLYEPCGLTQLRAQRYGAPPIVRRVGGLADTVEDGVSGFAFDGYSPDALQEAGFRALRGYADSPRWQTVVRHAMARDFSWERSVDQYLEVYRRAIAHAAMR